MQNSVTEFKNIKFARLHTGQGLKRDVLEYISRASYCFGCQAWCTDLDILDALAAKKGVQMVIQNDKVATRNYKYDGFRIRLRDKYRRLPKMDWTGWENVFWNGIPDIPAHIQRPSVLIERDRDNCSVRYAGCRQNQVDRQIAKNTDQISMMHHKFLLYANEKGRIYGITTGSMNFTANASQSEENFMYFEDPDVVKAWFFTFLRVLQHSTPLRI